jgi:geranylgeranylglycerol-phosphate geranylgeranyltransferase
MRSFLFVVLPSLLRLHIVGVALFATLVFGWLFTGRHPFELVPLVAIDWFVINLMNRVTDVAEDVQNRVPGAELAARRSRLLALGSALLFASSLAVSHVASPALTPWRLAVQAIGLAYNVRVLPVPARGGLRWSRFKELYFFKNFMSSVLFVLTCFVYPLAAFGSAPLVGWGAAAVLACFFVPFELTYEILYDLRDLEGDRREGVPTYPVAHGEAAAVTIVKALLVGSAAVLLAGFATRLVGVRELLMLAAPSLQWAFARPRLARGLTHADCVWLTHLGSAELALFLVGTEAWLGAGLPANVWLP